MKEENLNIKEEFIDDNKDTVNKNLEKVESNVEMDIYAEENTVNGEKNNKEVKTKVAKQTTRNISEVLNSKKENISKLSRIISELNKKLSDEEGQKLIVPVNELDDLEFVKTGIVPFDAVCGLPINRVTLFWGASKEGKTTTALTAAASYINTTSNPVIYIDNESKLDKKWALQLITNKRQNPENEKLFHVIKPLSDDKTYRSLIDLIKKVKNCMIIFDSITQQLTTAEKERIDINSKNKNIADDTMAIKARSLNKFLNVLPTLFSAGKIVMVFISQIRSQIGNAPVPLPPAPTGGHGVMHSVSLAVKISTIKPSSAEVIQQQRYEDDNRKIFQYRFEKSQVGIRNGIVVESNFYELHGIDTIADIVDYGLYLNIISRNGSILSYTTDSGKVIKQQGLYNFEEALSKESQDVIDEITNKIYLKFKELHKYDFISTIR